jgi:PAT family beta-lactamase induction signal transducer AmpG
MKTEGVDLGTISLFSLVGLPYALKFLWAPLLDRFVPPFMGRRRGWLILTQLALMIAVAAMSFSHPSAHPLATAAIALLVSFLSASQDIVADAYKTDALAPEEWGPGSALFTTGYRVAMLVSGAVALILSDHLSWRAVYLVMAATLLIGALTSWLAPEPAGAALAPRTLREAVVEPFREFFSRKGAAEVIAFITLYKLDAVMTLALMTPFMMEMGFSRTDIGAVTKGFGLVATIAGTLVGGTLMVKLGLQRALWLFGFAQAFSGLSFLGLALLGHSYPMMVTAIAVENACSGMGNSAYAAFLMSQCDTRFSATQYALLSSLMAVTRVVLGSPTGYLAQSLGWPGYYAVCTLVSVPAFILLIRFPKWNLWRTKPPLTSPSA